MPERRVNVGIPARIDQWTIAAVCLTAEHDEKEAEDDSMV
jgi:hypothetical protein